MSWTGHADDSEAAAAGLKARAEAGDQAALEQLHQATLTWAPNHKNAAIDAWNSLGIGDHLSHIKNPHHGIAGALGSILKVAAPIAGALIPGVGPLGAMAIGGLGSAAGGALHGDKFNLGKTIAAGGAAAAGNKLLGNGLGNVGGTHGIGGPGAGEPGSSSTGGNTPSASGGGAAAGQTGGSDPLGRFGKIGDAIQKYGPLGLGVAGTLENANAQGAATDLRNKGIDYATNDWNARAPIRDAARTRLLAPIGPRRDLSSTYEDPTDPYKRPKVAPLGAGSMAA